MKIVLSSPRGFCAGVNMAIDCLARALEFFGPPVYVFHEIVHNKHVVARFIRLGAVFVDSLDEVPEAAPLLFSAHGVSPRVREDARRRGLRAIDATCPLVAKVHLETVRFASEGYTILLIGHAGHDEVLGTMGEAPDRVLLVETVDDAERIAVSNPEKVAYLTQTTLSVDETAQIIAVLRRRFPSIVYPSKDDICYATQNRQEAVRALAAEADVVLVFGSRNSSNSKRLAEIAATFGPRAYLVDDVADIRPEWFNGSETVLVTAGASAPEEVVQASVGFLEEQYGATVEEVSIRAEHVHFPPPKSLLKLVSIDVPVH